MIRFLGSIECAKATTRVPLKPHVQRLGLRSVWGADYALPLHVLKFWFFYLKLHQICKICTLGFKQASCNWQTKYRFIGQFGQPVVFLIHKRRLVGRRLEIFFSCLVWWHVAYLHRTANFNEIGAAAEGVTSTMLHERIWGNLGHGQK